MPIAISSSVSALLACFFAGFGQSVLATSATGAGAGAAADVLSYCAALPPTGCAATVGECENQITAPTSSSSTTTSASALDLGFDIEEGEGTGDEEPSASVP